MEDDWSEEWVTPPHELSKKLNWWTLEFEDAGMEEIFDKERSRNTLAVIPQYLFPLTFAGLVFGGYTLFLVFVQNSQDGEGLIVSERTTRNMLVLFALWCLVVGACCAAMLLIMFFAREHMRMYVHQYGAAIHTVAIVLASILFGHYFIPPLDTLERTISEPLFICGLLMGPPLTVVPFLSFTAFGHPHKYTTVISLLWAGTCGWVGSQWIRVNYELVAMDCSTSLFNATVACDKRPRERELT